MKRSSRTRSIFHSRLGNWIPWNKNLINYRNSQSTLYILLWVFPLYSFVYTRPMVNNSKRLHLNSIFSHENNLKFLCFFFCCCFVLLLFLCPLSLFLTRFQSVTLSILELTPRTGWPWTYGDPTAGIKGICYHCPADNLDFIDKLCCLFF